MLPENQPIAHGLDEKYQLFERLECNGYGSLQKSVDGYTPVSERRLCEKINDRKPRHLLGICRAILVC